MITGHVTVALRAAVVLGVLAGVLQAVTGGRLAAILLGISVAGLGLLMALEVLLYWRWRVGRRRARWEDLTLNERRVRAGLPPMGLD